MSSTLTSLRSWSDALHPAVFVGEFWGKVLDTLHLQMEFPLAFKYVGLGWWMDDMVLQGGLLCLAFGEG